MPVPRARIAIAAGVVAALAATTFTAFSSLAGAAEPTAVANGKSIVHLFQWRWDSVAAECESTLGPNGWGGVQVSPPQEHVLIASAEGASYPWWQD